jgi:hypothetical protein
MLDALGTLRYGPNMKEKTAKPIKPTDKTKAERLKHALKSNLARRKAQARARDKGHA